MTAILVFDKEIQIYYTNDFKKGTTLKNNEEYYHVVGTCGFGEGARVKIWLVKNDQEIKDQLIQQNVVADFPYKETSMTDLRVNRKNIVEKDG